MAQDFSADAHSFLLAVEALRVRFAYIFDPRIALYSSDVEALPHQIDAVYHYMLPKLPNLRFCLCDDPGAGKTIMAGLLIKEAIARGQVRRCLIVCPSALAEQWQDEMQTKFHLHFSIITNKEEASFDSPLCIGALDTLCRNEDNMASIRQVRWDLAICDEAHKMSASLQGKDIKRTKRYALGQLLSATAQNFLLMTATPHNGKAEDFALFIALLGKNARPKDVMLRRVKEDLRRMDGSPLFPKRLASTLLYALSSTEQSLYDDVTEYVREGMGRAEALSGGKKNTIGFALMVLQRRLASSPEAIYQSLRRRREKLETALKSIESGKYESTFDICNASLFDDDDYAACDMDEAADISPFMMTYSVTASEYKDEIARLKGLESKADALRYSGDDRKWEDLSRLLQDNEDMFSSHGREKLIIFTEHRDTLNYIAQKVQELLPTDDVIVIHGGLSRAKRAEAESAFKTKDNAHVLVATDAAGEGVNLQCAHLMVNYDLPWNPNRLEQRFGRIHRIGQTKTCRLWSMAAKGTREGAVFSRLLEKLETERGALGGKVFDVLGELRFDGKSLSDLLIEAVKSTDDGSARIADKIDAAVSHESVERILIGRKKDSISFTDKDAFEIERESQYLNASKMQPHYIADFFMDAFGVYGGKMYRRDGLLRYEILQVPRTIQKARKGVQISYSRVCFDKKFITVLGKKAAQLIAPGHPLLDALTDVILKTNMDALQTGAILLDDKDDIRLLYITKSTVTNKDGGIVRSVIYFDEVTQDGKIHGAGKAPCADCSAPSPSQKDALKGIIAKNTWLNKDAKDAVLAYRANASESKIIGRAIIIPRAMLLLSAEEQDIYTASAQERKRMEQIAMQAVMQTEISLGFICQDVSLDNCGYDIESSPPVENKGNLRLIEVKGLSAEKDTVIVTKNEVNTAMNILEGNNSGIAKSIYILALAQVSGGSLSLTYIQNPFSQKVEDALNSGIYSIKELLQRCKVILKRTIPLVS